MSRRRERRAYVAKLRAKTHCQICGAQPIEWHHLNPQPGDIEVSRLANHGGPIEEIDREIAKCTPLCRTCHVWTDGRVHNLRNQ